MNDDIHTLESGHLDVGDGHNIYYQRWGNKDGDPIFVFHGGPGSASKQTHKLAFEPTKHHVVFHDQRGCGQSTYTDQLKDVTIQKLVDDIDRLKNHLKIDTIQLYGHSWGSTLALYYAIERPKSVSKLLIGGVYTASNKETDYLHRGGLSTHFPEAWDYFSSVVPDGEMSNIFEFYEKKLTTGSFESRLEYYKRWSQLEYSAVSIDPDNRRVAQESQDKTDLEGLELDLLSIHYFKNGCFLPDRYILDNAHKLSEIQTVIIQGRHDVVCPPDTAYELARNIGESCHLHIVPGAHKAEGALREVQRAYAWSFLD